MNKKTIGIITLHYPINYGAVLQSYALNKYLNSAEYDAYTIDYKSINKRQKGGKAFLIKLYSCFYVTKLRLKSNRFKEFIRNNIRLSDYVASKDKLKELSYDKFICGSDQIWRPDGRGKDDSYFLSFVKDNKKKISYAASFGISQLNCEQVKYIASYIKDFNYISVREKAGKKLVENILDKEISLVCDPVFLLSRESWYSIAKPVYIQKKYILLYFLHNADNLAKNAVTFAKKNNYQVISVGFSLRNIKIKGKKLYDAGPAEFLDLVRNAEYIFTNSFHGVAFSIIMHKNFVVSPIGLDPEKNSNSRINHILDISGLTTRSISNEKFNNIIRNNIDYKIVDYKLSLFIEQSKRFLKVSIEN